MEQAQGTTEQTEVVAKVKLTPEERAAERDRKLAEKEAKGLEKIRQAARKKEEAYAQKAAERKAKEEEKLRLKDEERAQREAQREAEKAEAKAKREAEKETQKAERAAEREANKTLREKAQAEARAQREADRAAAKQAEKEAAAKEVAAKEAARAANKAAIEARREANKGNTGRRRAKAFVRNAEGFSKVQEHSVRGKLLKFIEENFEVGQPVEIEALGAQVAHMLYGSPIRSYLSKLEEAGHIDYVIAEEAPELSDEEKALLAQAENGPTEEAPVETPVETPVEEAPAEESEVRAGRRNRKQNQGE